MFLWFLDFVWRCLLKLTFLNQNGPEYATTSIDSNNSSYNVGESFNKDSSNTTETTETNLVDCDNIMRNTNSSNTTTIDTNDVNAGKTNFKKEFNLDTNTFVNNNTNSVAIAASDIITDITDPVIASASDREHKTSASVRERKTTLSSKAEVQLKALSFVIPYLNSSSIFCLFLASTSHQALVFDHISNLSLKLDDALFPKGCNFLEPFRNLNKLKIHSKNRVDYVFKSMSCTRVKFLNVHTRCSPMKNNFIARLTLLETLELPRMTCTDTAALLSPLVNLRKLNLKNCKNITNFDGLQTLHRLKSLNVRYGEQLTSMNVFAKATQLEELDISFSSIQDLEPLCNFPNLNKLKMKNIDLATFPSIGFSNLKFLDIKFCSVLDVNWIQSAANITHLVSNENNIMDFQPLQQFKSLQVLSLKNEDYLSDIDFLESMTTLTSIHLHRCDELENGLPPLNKLENLIDLDIQWCQDIQDFSAIGMLPNLQHLVLRGCGSLKNIDFLSTVTTLKTVNLSWSEVSVLEPLCNSPGLQRVNLIFTQVTKYEQLIPLLHLHQKWKKLLLVNFIAYSKKELPEGYRRIAPPSEFDNSFEIRDKSDSVRDREEDQETWEIRNPL